jgi:ABC-2 type transport system ATP-binding protein
MSLSVVDLQKVYDNTLAVSSLTFDAAAGNVTGLLGPNGAGKTTTMRIATGIIPATRGTVIVDGYDIAKEPIDAKMRIAYVPDDPKLFDTLTVWEHLDFMSSAYRVADFAPRAEQLLQQFELEPKRNTIARELSRGMRQKVAIACAYLREPSVILFDEPMTGLDPHGIRTLKRSIREQAARGAAVLLSSHLLSLMEGLCTHLVILHQGSCLFRGSVAEAAVRFPGIDGDQSLEEIFFQATRPTTS